MKKSGGKGGSVNRNIRTLSRKDHNNNNNSMSYAEANIKKNGVTDSSQTYANMNNNGLGLFASGMGHN